ncbi:MAG: leader peptide processing enzyme [Spirochaetaceae bacterium]|jgi:branched-subunit amino acid ABC-type transport system permease component|nr:leader peptide processing enzyme [Spirochaetaceae bacterium]
MNKKTNTVLFMLGATVANVIITVVIFLVILLLYVKFLAPSLPETAQVWGLPISFVVAIVLSFLLYRACIKVLSKKINVEKYFDPLFVKKRK